MNLEAQLKVVDHYQKMTSHKYFTGGWD